MTSISQKAVKEANHKAIRAFFSSHLCATNRECAEALGLNVCVVGRHVKSIRAEWKNHNYDSTLTKLRTARNG